MGDKPSQTVRSTQVMERKSICKAQSILHAFFCLGVLVSESYCRALKPSRSSYPFPDPPSF